MKKSETTKKTSKEKNNKAYLFYILIGVFFLLVFSLPFIHSEFKKLQEWEPYSKHYNSYDLILDNYKKDKSLLLSNLSERKIDIDKYVTSVQALEIKKSKDLKNYNKIKKKLKKEYSLLGYSSTRYFLYAIGMPLLALCLSFFVLYVVYNPKTIHNYNQFYKVICIGFIYVTSFWSLRAFLTRTDFPRWSYNLSYVISAILVTGLVLILIRVIAYINSVKQQTQEDLKSIIDSGNELIHTFKKTV